MAWSVVIIVIALIVAGIWLIFKWNRIKSKIFAIFIIAIILFSAFSLIMAFKGKDLSIKNVSDVKEMFQIYFSWFAGAFNNIKVITTNAVKMDWKGNQTT